MESRLWLKESFSINSIPDWPCPICKKATLTLKRSDLKYEEPASSSRNHNHEDFDPEWIDYIFNCILRCSNKSCNEIVMTVGIGGITMNTYITHDQSFDDRYEPYFRPLFFLPALHLINIKPNCPPPITQQIVNAFGLYWNDQSACANQIRIALEMIMDDHGIKRTYINDKKKRKDLPLHNRIELFGKKYSDLKNHLIAIKWIGNSGSHVGVLEKVDLIDAFNLLEYCIEKLYDDREKELKKISKQIVKTKKPRHAKPQSFGKSKTTK